MGEFKAGPGDEAKLLAKIRAFPDADVAWYLKTPKEGGEEGEYDSEKVDKDDKKFSRYIRNNAQICLFGRKMSLAVFLSKRFRCK